MEDRDIFNKEDYCLGNSLDMGMMDNFGIHCRYYFDFRVFMVRTHILQKIITF